MVAPGLLPIADQLTLLAQALPPSSTPRCAG
jgi:hypothetical protein